MTAVDVKKVTAWVVLGVYIVVLLTLLQPGGAGQGAVTAFGEAFAALAT